MASEVSIVNQALARVAQGTIVNLSDNDRLSRVASLHYEDKRDALLRDYRWKFAIKRIELPALLDPPEFGHRHAYQLPADSLRALSVNEIDPEFDPDLDPAIWDREGPNIVTDEEPPIKVRYIARITDTTRFDPSFVDALSIYLAIYFVPSFRELDPNLPVALREEFKDIVSVARRTSAIEGRPQRRKHTRSAWVRGRSGFVS